MKRGCACCGGDWASWPCLVVAWCSGWGYHSDSGRRLGRGAGPGGGGEAGVAVFLVAGAAASLPSSWLALCVCAFGGVGGWGGSAGLVHVIRRWVYAEAGVLSCPTTTTIPASTRRSPQHVPALPVSVLVVLVVVVALKSMALAPCCQRVPSKFLLPYPHPASMDHLSASSPKPTHNHNHTQPQP